MNSIDHISAFIFSEYTLYPFISFPANISAISHLILTQLNFGLRIWSPLQNTNPTIYSTLHFIADYQVCLIVLYLISAKIPLSINWSFNGFPVIIYRKKITGRSISSGKVTDYFFQLGFPTYFIILFKSTSNVLEPSISLVLSL